MIALETEWLTYSTVGQTPPTKERLEAGEARRQLQDSWATGHTVIQVITLRQWSLSKKKTDWHFLALWFAFRMQDWKLAWLHLSWGERVQFWCDSLIVQNVWLSITLCMLFPFSKTAQDIKNFKLEQGPDLLVHGCVIQGQPKTGRNSRNFSTTELNPLI